MYASTAHENFITSSLYNPTLNSTSSTSSFATSPDIHQAGRKENIRYLFRKGVPLQGGNGVYGVSELSLAISNGWADIGRDLGNMFDLKSKVYVKELQYGQRKAAEMTKYDCLRVLVFLGIQRGVKPLPMFLGFCNGGLGLLAERSDNLRQTRALLLAQQNPLIRKMRDAPRGGRVVKRKWALPRQKAFQTPV
ncbi:hypothetical protein BO70DRAFT_397298 [Aspergillus heteromorphus CBS 117.55]|uniref:Uncharacterized protein n=1 Tax=Aspergillus heteromorphus CBS 117.55 TaxID=1448321 RepID=A0A317W1N7_9EURO|nr:uncharacterized protein BO70DRAFT_397298 [Aspergillus heteromorphus CBS 117.55]PWY79182.1 hypothetical protein BO70DRAFT_397298 [Aspergillus heteromorphus CBS 117.55]